MAKKVVATLRDKTKAASVIKVVRAIKNTESGSYSFKSDMVQAEQLNDFLAGKDIRK